MDYYFFYMTLLYFLDFDRFLISCIFFVKKCIVLSVLNIFI